MTLASVTTLITDLVGDYGTYVLAILGVTLGLALAYIGFKFGWKKLRGAVK